jgi:hypothetical protein
VRDYTDIPNPVRPLGRHGLRLWERCWQHGSRWIDDGADIEMVQIVCEQTDERVKLRQLIMGEDWPDYHHRAALRSIEASITGGLAALGFSPSDRARMGVAAEVAADPLAALRRARSS